jgi:hypothetical protein
MQPKYKMSKVIHTDILVMKWKLFAPKRKITLRQINSGNLLIEETASYKIVVLTIPL